MYCRSTAFLLALLLAFGATSGLAAEPHLDQDTVNQLLLQGMPPGALPSLPQAAPGLPANVVQALQPASRSGTARTIDELQGPELDRISRATLAYYRCVADKTAAVTAADRRSPDRVFATYPPYILIMRQQCRISLVNVEKELYSLKLNPEFITNYVTMLRDDVVHFALQETLKRTGFEPAGTGGAQAPARPEADKESQERPPVGFGILTPHKKDETPRDGQERTQQQTPRP